MKRLVARWRDFGPIVARIGIVACAPRARDHDIIGLGVVVTLFLFMQILSVGEAFCDVANRPLC